jgi:metallo-beta-lactamase class B
MDPRWFLLSWLLLAGAAPVASRALPRETEATRINEELRVERLADGAYLIVHERPWPSNSLLVEMPDGTLVLCDTPSDDQATAALLEWIATEFGEREVVAINGHFHPDAMGGNRALKAAGARSYGSELSARMLSERGPKVHDQMLVGMAEDLIERYAQSEWQPPEHLFPEDEGLELRFGDERVVVYYPGPGHTPDNVVTWFPERKLLFGGCLLRTVPRMGNVVDADLERYPQTVENLRRFDAEIVVPGHGRVGGPELLDITLEAAAAAVQPTDP